MQLVDSPLVLTKLRVPAVRLRTVRRTRLLELLTLEPDAGLVLVSAPAGYGKTTLLAEWSQSLLQHGGAMAWYALDTGDDAPGLFGSYLVASLSQALGPTAELAPVAQLLRSTPAMDLQRVLPAIINAIVASERDCVLVLDDYHLISAPAIHSAVAYLLERRPEHMHIAIGSRSDPPLPLARLRARGQLLEIRAADLQFTAEETAQFLNETMRLGLSPDMVAALEARTEGWIAGLQLAALSLSGRPDTASFISSFTGSNRYLIEYLLQEVVSRQPPEVQRFLFFTSVLERMCGPLCDAILGDHSGSEAILEQLEQSNLFVAPLDDQGYWHRYHQLFRDFLCSHLIHLHSELVPELHRRAAIWHERNRLVAEAVGHALLARDYGYAANLVEQAALSMIKRSEISTWLVWMKALPGPVRQEHPALSLYYAWMLLRTGQLQAAEQLLAGLSKGDLPPQLENLLDVVWAQLFLLSGNTACMFEVAERALTAEQRIATGDELHLIILSSATALLAEAQRLQGKVKTAMQTYRRSLAQAKPEDVDASWLPAVGLLGMRLGLLLYEQNDLEAAEQHVAHCLEIAQRSNNEVNQAQGLVYLALIKQAQGNPGLALEVIQRGTRLAHKGSPAHVVLYFDAHQAKLMLMQGDLSAASIWAQSYQPGSNLEGSAGLRIEFVQRFADCVWARVLLGQGKPGEAARFLEELRLRAESTGHMGVVIETLALQALAFQAQGETGRACTVLERALTLGEPEGYVRTFADEGERMHSLLQRLQEELPAHGQERSKEKRTQTPEAQDQIGLYLERLLVAFLKPDDACPAESSNRRPMTSSSDIVEPLSDRELEVLRLIARGASNHEIADQLVITLGTVKSHINHISVKLDVHNRTEAVARARERGLLRI